MGRTARRDYGSGSVYQRADGRWIGSVELGTESGTLKRRRKTVSGKTKADVVAKLKAVNRQVAETGTVAVSVPTVGKYLEWWLDNVARNRVAPKTLRDYRSAVDVQLIPHLGRYRLDKLTPRHVLALHDTLRSQEVAARHELDETGQRVPRTLSESSILKTHAVLSRALADAVAFGHIARNPAKMVDRPKQGEPDIEHLDAVEASYVLRHVADDPMGSRWAFALLTGARAGEILGLRWSHVDLDTGMADVSWQLQRLSYAHGCAVPCGRRFAGDCPDRQLDVPRGYTHEPLDGGLCLTRPKGGKRRRVPLIPSLAAWLRRHRQETPPGPHDLVWARDGGRPIDPRRDYDAWLGLLAACDLPPVTRHSSRHSAVSLLLGLGVQEAVIMQIAGHSTVAAARRYQHVDDAAARAALRQLGQLLAIEKS